MHTLNVTKLEQMLMHMIVNAHSNDFLAPVMPIFNIYSTQIFTLTNQ